MEPQQDITLAEIYLTPLIAYRQTSPIVAVSRADYTAYIYNTTLGPHPATQMSALWTSSFVSLNSVSCSPKTMVALHQKVEPAIECYY